MIGKFQNHTSKSAIIRECLGGLFRIQFSLGSIFTCYLLNGRGFITRLHPLLACWMVFSVYSHQPVQRVENDPSFEQQQHGLGGPCKIVRGVVSTHVVYREFKCNVCDCTCIYIYIHTRMICIHSIASICFQQLREKLFNLPKYPCGGCS